MRSVLAYTYGIGDKFIFPWARVHVCRYMCERAREMEAFNDEWEWFEIWKNLQKKNVC